MKQSSNMAGHRNCDCAQSHQSVTEDLGNSYTLYLKIDKSNVQCLNETVEGAGAKVFKPWDKRLDTAEVISLTFLYCAQLQF
jgi:hypothetical protein